MTYTFPYDDGHIAWHCSEIPFVFHNTELVAAYNEEGVTDLLEKRKSYYYYNDKKHNYMSYWESNSIRGTFDWRTNEYVHLLNRKSPEQIAQITAGSITDWVTGNAPLYRQVYGMLDTGTKFSKKSLRLWQNKIYPIATEQVAVAGYRLAALLNSLFDSNAANVKLK